MDKVQFVIGFVGPRWTIDVLVDGEKAGSVSMGSHEPVMLAIGSLYKAVKELEFITVNGVKGIIAAMFPA